LTEAKKAVREETDDWQPLSDASGHDCVCLMEGPLGKERWVMVHTDDGSVL
jgi:hypothetical protein